MNISTNNKRVGLTTKSIMSEVRVANKHQRDTIKKGEELVRRGKGMLMASPTGTGKTLMALNIMLNVCNTNDDDMNVLVICPFQGGSVPKQWVQEAIRCGVPESQIFVFLGPTRENAIFEWKKNVSSAPKEDKIFKLCITTPQTLLSASKHGSSMLFDIKWTHVISDEAHMWRNGSSHYTDVEVDENKKMYVAMNTNIIIPCNPVCVFLSATAYCNHPLDVYSLGRLMNIEGLSKKKWLGRQENNGEFKQQKALFLNHVITTDGIKLPETTYTTIYHAPMDEERNIIRAQHNVLLKKLDWFSDALRKCGQHPNVLEFKVKCEQARLAFEGACTRSRRLCIHPGLYFHIKNESREFSESQPRKKNGELSEEDIDTIVNAFPIEMCSKFKATLELIQTSKCKGKKLLILSYWKGALKLLERYMSNHIPDRKVFTHFGGSNNKTCMEEFEETDEDAIMLATRGSIGEGVSMHWLTDIIFLDPARSSAEQKQAEGRVKRPLVQTDVSEWLGYHVRYSESNFKTVEDWLYDVQSLKKQGNIDMFTSTEELKDAGKETNHSVISSEKTHDGPLRMLRKVLTYQYEVEKEMGIPLVECKSEMGKRRMLQGGDTTGVKKRVKY